MSDGPLIYLPQHFAADHPLLQDHLDLQNLQKIQRHCEA